jgi:hypothetical protein
MSAAEDRLKKVAEEQALHIAALKEKLDKIDTLSSKNSLAILYTLTNHLTNYHHFRGPSLR